MEKWLIPEIEKGKMQEKPETSLMSENKKGLNRGWACQKVMGVNLKVQDLEQKNSNTLGL